MSILLSEVWELSDDMKERRGIEVRIGHQAVMLSLRSARALLRELNRQVASAESGQEIERGEKGNP